MSELSLDDVLNGNISQEAITQVETQTQAPEQEAEQVTEEPSQNEPEAVEEPTSEPEQGETTAPEASEKEPEDWQYKAYKDERSKRQERDAKIQELEAKLAEKTKIPDVFEDQDGFVNSLRSEMQEQVTNIRTDLSRQMMMSLHDDYQEKEDIFVKLAEESPELLTQLRQSSNPAKFAYDQAKKHEEFKQMQDVDSYKAKIRAEIEAQIKSEYEQKAKSEADKTSNITPSLANARAAKESEAVSMPSLDDLL